MQRKPGYPVANCNIKMPDAASASDSAFHEDEGDQHQRRLQLINFGHSQWGFNNWNWSVSKQELDFIDFTNGKYVAGVVAFVNVTLKNLDIHRENIGYATSVATTKGMAIYTSRKCAVTNALKETLLSFGGTVANELLEALETHRDPPAPVPAPEPEVPPVANKLPEPKNSPLNRHMRKDSSECSHGHIGRNVPAPPPPVVPIAAAHPMPANLNPASRAPLPANAPRPVRPNSNVSYVLQPVVPPMYAPPPRMPHVGPPPHFFPNAYYEYSGPWHLTYEPYERPHGNVNLNFNMPPKNLVVNGRDLSCKSACRPPNVPEDGTQYGPPPSGQGCWIKPTIFYDGFWTEQKVKKWVAEQVEKQFPEDGSYKPSSPSAGQADSTSKS